MIYGSIERRKIATERHLPASSGCFRHNPSPAETILRIVNGSFDRSANIAPTSEYYGDHVASHLAPTARLAEHWVEAHRLGEVTMDTDKTDNPIKEVRDGLFTLLESMETQNAAVLEFLKDQGLATDEKLAPYLNRAASASSVKWRAARSRMSYLLAPAPKRATDQKEAPDAKEKAVEQKDTQPKDAGTRDAEL